MDDCHCEESDRTTKQSHLEKNKNKKKEEVKTGVSVKR